MTELAREALDKEHDDELTFISVEEFPAFDDVDSTTIVDDGEPLDADNELDEDLDDLVLLGQGEES